MLRLQESETFGVAPAASAAASPFVRLVPPSGLAPRPAPAAVPVPPGFDLAPDLAEDIGSRRWYRGMITLIALIIAALAFWPDLSALEAAPATRLDPAAAAEFHTQAFSAVRVAPQPARPLAGPGLRYVAFVPERPQIALTAELPAGESLGRLFQRAGVSGSDAARASELVAGAVPLEQLAPGTRVALVLGPRPAPGPWGRRVRGA